ncbi:MAG: methyl-accepting chemotaxis protein [Leptospirales bacterium]|nr:methyl-accepting chemotaxis protein [Leptospirales bacterium]
MATQTSRLGKRIIRELSVALLGCFLLLSGASTFYLARESAQEEALRHAQGQAARMETYLGVQMDTAVGFGTALARYKAISRSDAIAVLQDITTRKSQFLGSYVLFEPNQFDGKDADFRDAPGHDNTGRFVPYLVRVKDRIDLEANKDYEKEGAGDYYLLPKRTGLDQVIEPYEYPIDGKPTLITSFIHTLKRNGTFVGISGIDISLDYLQSEVAKLAPGGSGRVTILSHKGLIVASGLEGAKPGKPLTDLGFSKESLGKIEAGVEFRESTAQYFAVFVPITIGSAKDKWSVLVTYPQSAILLRALSTLGLNLIAIVAALIVAIVVLIRVVSKRVSTPLQRAARMAQEIAEGNLTGDAEQTKFENDEVGDLQKSLQQMMVTLRGIVAQIRKDSGETVRVSERMAEASQTLSTGTEEMSQQTQSIAAASTELNQNLEVVSSSIEEMSISVSEIARRSVEAASVAGEANEKTSRARNIVQQLGEDAREIGKVIDSIVDISDQTNLLALNAAIEAADAGESGRRFAVVASEVKELARQTGESSEEIRGRIESIQRSSEETVLAIQSITDVIQKVNEVNAAIATFVEEQSITAREISSNATQAASGSTEVARNVTNVSTVIKQGASEATTISRLAAQLNTMSQQLNDAIGKFRIKGQ